jgi:Ser/Thr protein kinase RdoA (MazF antagonist)
METRTTTATTTRTEAPVPDDPHADDEVARRALAEYDFSPDVQLRMINLSENATFLVEDSASGRDGVLRVHRVDYHPPESIHSELLWLDALRTDAGIHTPAVLPARDGRRVVTLEHGGTDRHAVLFEMMGGIEPDETAVGHADFRTLGGLTAQLHRHGREWRRPPGFTRFSWDWEHTLGSAPRWGRWQDGIGIGDQEVALLSQLSDLVESRLRAFGDDSDRFGLVHADLRLANLLVDGDRVNVIDFDDCGFSWFLYDFGSAVSFMEDDPRLPEWQAAWVDGYRDVAELSDDEEQMLATFVMLRRMMLVAWMGSHSHSKECQVKGPGYARGTCELAERYLSSGGRSP